MNRALLLIAFLAAASSFAQSRQLPGRGRITVMPGYSLVPDGPFVTNAQNALGTKLQSKTPGAPSLWGSFGYGANDALEVAIDLLGSLQTLQFEGREAIQRLTYGAGVAPRLYTQLKLGSMELQPYLTLGVAGAVISATGGGLTRSESFVTGYSAGVGATLVPGESFGIGIDYRFLYARGRAPVEVGGTINGGGHFLLLSFSWFIAGDPPSQSGSDFR